MNFTALILNKYKYIYFKNRKTLNTDILDPLLIRLPTQFLLGILFREKHGEGGNFGLSGDYYSNQVIINT